MQVAMLQQWIALAAWHVALVPPVSALSMIPSDPSAAKLSRRQRSLSMTTSISRTTGFLHGVGSFDPCQDGIMLWTRYAPLQSQMDTPVHVQWEIEDTKGGSKQWGIATTTADSDFTVRVKVDGLKSYTSYFYSFSVNGDKSVRGRTKTLPAPGDTDTVKVAVVSCANYMSCFFHVYREIAESDVDVLIHLGDYIYEYAPGGFGTSAWTFANNRTHEPAKEAVTLADYRTRYRQYRSDADAQLAHQNKPFIMIYDDHESANDAWKDGAENHNTSTQGPWSVRKAASLKAWHEYFPSVLTMGDVNYRSFDFGDLLTLFMMDTRLVGRDEQVSLSDFIDATGTFDVDAAWKALWSLSRGILGARQLGWLRSGMAHSSAIWQLLGSSVLMGKYWLPSESVALGERIAAAASAGQDPTALIAQLSVALEQLSAIKIQIQAGVEVWVEDRARVTTGPVNTDAWDGYLVEREMVYNGAVGKNLISIAGDSHNAWHHKLTDISGAIIGHEFATASISSPGLEGPLGQAFAQALVAPFVLLSEDTLYADLANRGYVHLTFTHKDVVAKYIFVSSVFDPVYTVVQGHSVTVSATHPHTPKPEHAPEPTQKERCKDSCYRTDRPWSAKCGWKSCTACSGCPVKPCRSWCAEKVQPWKKKCNWDTCSGCSQCTPC